MGFRFEMGFTMFSLFFTVMFVFILGLFVFVIVKNLSVWHKNNNSPRLSVPATVVAKRTNISHRHHDHHTHTHTQYYVTFEFDSTDRIELLVDGSEYGLLVESDHGDLTFQGTRYIGFVRS